MIIDQLFTRPLFESQMDPITQFASNAHEEWRRNFDPTGTKPRVKKNSDGTEGDINVPFADLHPDWQKENLAAGHAAHRAVKHFGRNMEKAAEYVHNEWMKRNPRADYNAAQHVPYDDLPDDEKEKDRVHVRTMMRLMGHQPEQNIDEASAANDYFTRRKSEEERIAGVKAPARNKKNPANTDYAKRRKQQDVTEDATSNLLNMRRDDPRIQQNQDINDVAKEIYAQMVAERGQPMDRGQQNNWMAIAQTKAAAKLQQSTQQPQQSFPSQGSERSVANPAAQQRPGSYVQRSANYDNFESQGITEAGHDHRRRAADSHDDEECSSCDGTGEGRHEGQSCGACGGSGVSRGHYDHDDFEIPDKDDMYEGVAETVSMDQAKKVLRHYGADHFKTTTNELHFYKNGSPLSVDLIFNDDATRSVSLRQLNLATRKLKRQGVTEVAQGHTIEAHGVRGMDRRTWHKTFRNTDQMIAWAKKHDAEIIGTRDLEQARHYKLSPARQGVAEGRVAQLPTRGADYSKYDTDHLKMMLRPGVLHRDEARFKALIRKELQKREQQSQQGVAEAFPNPGSGSTGSSKEDKRIAAALRKKHIPTTPNNKKEQGVAEDLSRRGFLKGAGAAGALAGAAGGANAFDFGKKNNEKKFEDFLTDPADKEKYLVLHKKAKQLYTAMAINPSLRAAAYSEIAAFKTFKKQMAEKYKIVDNIDEQGVAEGSGGNWYIRVNGKILNDTKFKPEIFSSEDEARSHAMKLADKKRIPLSQIKLTKSWMDAPEQGVAESNTLMNKLQRAMIKEGRVKELADDLKTLNDTEFMKKYGKAKAAIRKDMKKVDEGNANSGRRNPIARPDNVPVKLGRIEKLKTGIKHHADSSRYGGTVPDTDDDHLLSPASRHHLHKVVTPDHDIDEARTSAAQRLSTAWDRQRAKSDASLARTPGSIPKKPEPKKADPAAKTMSEHRVKRQALMAQMLNGH